MSRRRRKKHVIRSLADLGPSVNGQTAPASPPPEARERNPPPAPEILALRYAQSDDDVIAIYEFLSAMAAPSLPSAIDRRRSVEEIWRVVNYSVATMALRGARLVGTLGLTRQTFWWGGPSAAFLANRWFFVLPDEPAAGRALLADAKAIAKACALELHIIAEAKGKVVIINKSRRRIARRPAPESRPSPFRMTPNPTEPDDVLRQ
ncbi:MAG: hypothetical protein ACLPKB_24690 [Xanthobacteraceae bacterium]